MTHRHRASVVALLTLLFGVCLSAQQRGATPPAQQPQPAQPAPQQPAPQPAPAVSSQPAPPAAKPGEPGAPFTYSPEGRRDPFVSLLGKGSDGKGQGTRPAGVPGLLINEVSVKGIVRNSAGYVALIQGADNKTYVVKAGDRLLDGTVKSIVADAVVFSQDVSDPLSLVKQKEIRKPLRSAEGGRG
jgi:type IV pilus assembly protein PilP